MSDINNFSVSAITISQYIRKDFIKFTFEYLKRQKYLPTEWIILDSTKALYSKKLFEYNKEYGNECEKDVFENKECNECNENKECNEYEKEDIFENEKCNEYDDEYDKEDLFNLPSNINTLENIIESFRNENPPFDIVYKESHYNSIGKMRDQANTLVKCDIIVHFDDDDYYPKTRISCAVDSLVRNLPNKWLVGCCDPEMYDFQYEKIYKYVNSIKSSQKNEYYACCGTFAYWKSYSDNRSFDNNKECDEERKFTNSFKDKIIYVESKDSILISSHTQNTVSKKLSINQNLFFSNENKSIVRLYNYYLQDVIFDKDHGYVDDINFCNSIIKFFNSLKHTAYINKKQTIENSFVNKCDAIFYFGYFNNVDFYEYKSNVRLIIEFIKNKIYKNVIIYETPESEEVFKKISDIWVEYKEYISNKSVQIYLCEMYDYWNYDLIDHVYCENVNIGPKHFYIFGFNGYLPLYDLLKKKKIIAKKIYLCLFDNPNKYNFESNIKIFDIDLDIVRIFKNNYHKELFDDYLTDLSKYISENKNDLLETNIKMSKLNNYIFRPLKHTQYDIIPDGFDIIKVSHVEDQRDQVNRMCQTNQVVQMGQIDYQVDETNEMNKVNEKSKVNETNKKDQYSNYRNFYFCDETLTSLQRTIKIIKILNEYSKNLTKYKLYVKRDLLEKAESFDSNNKKINSDLLIKKLSSIPFIRIFDVDKCKINELCKISICYQISINNIAKNDLLWTIAVGMIPITPTMCVYKTIPGFGIRWLSDNEENNNMIANEIYNFCEYNVGFNDVKYSQETLLKLGNIMEWRNICEKYIS